MRKFFLALLCVALAGTAQAQIRLGIKGGLNFSDSKAVDIQSGWNGVFKSSTSWNAGVFAQIKLQGLSLQPELLYSEKGTDVLKMKYLDFPLSVRMNLFSIPNVITPFVLAGPYASYALSGKIYDVDLNYKKLDYGLGIGAGCDLFNRLLLTARYDWGLGKVAEDGYDVNAKNRVFSLSLGFYL